MQHYAAAHGHYGALWSTMQYSSPHIMAFRRLCCFLASAQPCNKNEIIILALTKKQEYVYYSVVPCGTGVLTSLDMDGWCKPVSRVAMFPQMFSNCASEVGRRVEEDAAGGAHPADGHESTYAHAVVSAGVVTNGSPCPHAALHASQTSTLVPAGRPWMVALRLVSSAKRVPRIWTT
ncbi:hypothetical protein B0H13DRAFT_1947466 [Mycena leptocephala]|nr:hypothetical protein B0H13DRAFT_1947466 [Mycena leptocephala]